MESSLLEKRLIFDHAKRTEEEIVRTTSYLEAFYDRQLPNIGGIAEESIGVNRGAITLFAKVLPRHGHHAGSSHGVNAESCGGEHALLGGTGQGNVFSGSACRDASCIMFKELEKKRVGVVNALKINGYKEHRVTIACADDADFCTSGAEYERKMQEIVNLCAQTHEDAGGKHTKRESCST